MDLSSLLLPCFLCLQAGIVVPWDCTATVTYNQRREKPLFFGVRIVTNRPFFGSFQVSGHDGHTWHQISALAGLIN